MNLSTKGPLRARDVGLAALIALPPVVMAWLAGRYFLRLPVADYWDVLHASYQLQDAGMRAHIAYYVHPFVDQLMVLPKWLIATLAQTTGNRHYGFEIALGFAAQVAVLGMVVSLQKSLPLIPPRARGLLYVVSSLMLFWPALLYRFQHHWYSTQYSLVLLFGVAAVYVLANSRGCWRGLGWCAAAVVLAAFSHGTALTLPLAVGLAMLWFPGWSRQQRIAGWLFSIALVTVIFTQLPSREILGWPPFTAALNDPRHLALFYIRTFSPQFWGLAAGIFVLGLLVWTLWQLKRQRRLNDAMLLPWFTILLWGLFANGTSSMARSSMYPAPSGVYLAFEALVVLSIIVLSVIAWHGMSERQRRTWNAARWIVVTVGLAIYQQGIRVGLRDAQELRQRIEWSAERLARYPAVQPDDLRWLFPPEQPRFARQLLPELVARGALRDFVPVPSRPR